MQFLDEAVQRIQGRAGERETIIIHLTDHDPSGLDMTRDLRARFNAYAAGFLFNVEVKRVALTFDQVQQYDLIPNPTKITDPRAGGYMARYGDECWELDAIEPPELVRLIHEAVEGEVTDREAWEAMKTQDEDEREDLRSLFEEWKDKYQ